MIYEFDKEFVFENWKAENTSLNNIEPIKDMLKELNLKFQQELEKEGNKYEYLQTEKNEMEMDFEEKLRHQEERHTAAMQELEQIRQECNRLQQETQKDAERVRQEALSFRQSTQQQAEALLLRSRQEAASVQQGANRYAEQVLGELDARLQEMAKEVIGGRRELVRLQNTDVELTQPEANDNKTVSINRVRRSARRIKEARDGSRSA